MALNVLQVIREKLNGFEAKIKNAFATIRSDIDEMSDKVELMRQYLKKKDKEFETNKKQEDTLRSKFEIQVDEFAEKIAQLKLALSSIKSMKNELVVVRDLAKIEERIKTSFKNEVDGYKEQVRYLKEVLKENEKRLKALEKGNIKNKEKKSFWSRSRSWKKKSKR